MKRVHVTHHAVEQARGRLPGAARVPAAELRRIIAADVADAWQAGRRARTQPRWLLHSDRSARRKASPGACYVWTAGETHAYVVAERHDRIVVITTLARLAQAA